MSSNGSGRIHLLGQQNPKNGKHNATLDEVHEIVVGVLGPLAQLLREVCIRQQAIEDHVGYVAPVIPPAVSENTGGDPALPDSNATPNGGNVE